MLPEDCQENNLLLVSEAEESSRTLAKQEFVLLLRSSQKLEDEVDENEIAEQHTTFMDWYSTLAEPEEEDKNVPLELAHLAQDQLKSAAEVCIKPC